MQYQSIVIALFAMISFVVASPVPQRGGRGRQQDETIPASEVAGGRVVLDGATCSPVQGVLICDDGFGNTL
jgi:hypothetical protein